MATDMKATKSHREKFISWVNNNLLVFSVELLEMDFMAGIGV